jgi:hypothetical protein
MSRLQAILLETTNVAAKRHGVDIKHPSIHLIVFTAVGQSRLLTLHAR